MGGKGRYGSERENLEDDGSFNYSVNELKILTKDIKYERTGGEDKMFKVTKKIGENTVEISTNTFKELCQEASQVPGVEKCICGSTKVSPNYRKVDAKEGKQGGEYYSIACEGCGAELKLSQHKPPLTTLYFIKGKGFEKYAPKVQPVAAAVPQAPAAVVPTVAAAVPVVAPVVPTTPQTI